MRLPTPDLHTSTSPGPQHASRALEAITSTSIHLQRASRAPELLRQTRPRASTSPGSEHASRAPDLLRQTPPRLHALTAKLQSFIPLRGNTLAARLHTS